MQNKNHPVFLLAVPTNKNKVNIFEKYSDKLSHRPILELDGGAITRDKVQTFHEKFIIFVPDFDKFLFFPLNLTILLLKLVQSTYRLRIL